MIVKIKNKPFNVKVCNSRKEIEEGMMGKKFDGFDGMLFFMGEDEHSFWMKNCIIPLDIIFISNNLLINNIHHNCPPCDDIFCDNYEGYGKYVLELPGGKCKELGITKGDSVKFNFGSH